MTLRTPRDVRTLVPSAVGHAILAVYDGDFVDGQLEFVAHLRGGRRWTEKLQLGVLLAPRRRGGRSRPA